MRHSIVMLWPAFMTASAIEVLVFGFVDPTDIQWMGAPLPLSTLGVYSVAFLAFWAVISCGFLLALSLRSSVEADQARRP